MTWTRAKQFSKVALVALSLLCLPGCWDYHRINDRAQILAIGIDPVEDKSNEYLITLQVPDFSTAASGGGKSGGTAGQPAGARQYRNDSVIAPSISQAVSLIQTWSDKQFFFGNLQAVILNRKLKGTGVRDIVDELMRIETVDRLAFILETNASAKQVLQHGDTSAPADSLDRSLGTAIKQHGYIPRKRLWEFWRDLNSVGIEPVCPLVKPTKHGLQFDGLVAFRGAKPVLDIHVPESLGYQLVVSHVHQMQIQVPDGDGRLSVGDLRSQGRWYVAFENGRPWLHIEVRAKADIFKGGSYTGDSIRERDIHRYESLVSQYLTMQVKSVVNQLQAEGADTMGFGRQILMKNPRTKEVIQRKWPQMFKTAQTDIRVKVTISRKGAIM